MCDFHPELLDILTLLADDNAGARRVNRDIRFLRRPLDADPADRCILELSLDELSHLVVYPDVLREIFGIRIPL